MEENTSGSTTEAKDPMDFPSLMIDQDAALSPGHAASPLATATPPRTVASTSCENSGGSAEAREIKEGEEKNSNEPTTGPSRMVTRSQTAAVRRPSYNSLSSPDLQIDHGQHQGGFQGDKGGQSVPSGLMDLSDEDESPDLNDLPSGKSSPRCGIDLGSVCPRCGAVLMTVSSRISHSTAHGQQGAHCRYCKQVFITTHGRDAHQNLHGDARTIDVDDYCECVLCGGAFISVMNLELHLFELHGREALLNPASFRMGISSGGEGDGGTDNGWALYHCGVCGHKFTYSFNLDCHMVLHARPSYCCAMCDASFSSFDPLITHVRIHRQPPMLAPIIHLAASGPARPATQTSTLVTVSPPKFSLTDYARKSNQTQGSFIAQPPHVLGLQRSPLAPAVASSALLNHSEGVGVPSTQTMLNYLLSQPPENRSGPSQPSRRGYFGLKVMHDTMKEERCPAQDDRNKQERDYYSR